MTGPIPLPLLAHNVFPAAWPGLLLAALVVTAAVMPRLGRGGGALLVLLSLAWLGSNSRLEGGVLISLNPAHGLTAGDLAGLAGLAVGACVLVRGRL